MGEAGPSLPQGKPPAACPEILAPVAPYNAAILPRRIRTTHRGATGAARFHRARLVYQGARRRSSEIFLRIFLRYFSMAYGRFLMHGRRKSLFFLQNQCWSGAGLIYARGGPYALGGAGGPRNKITRPGAAANETQSQQHCARQRRAGGWRRATILRARNKIARAIDARLAERAARACWLARISGLSARVRARACQPCGAD